MQLDFCNKTIDAQEQVRRPPSVELVEEDFRTWILDAFNMVTKISPEILVAWLNSSNSRCQVTLIEAVLAARHQLSDDRIHAVKGFLENAAGSSEADAHVAGGAVAEPARRSRNQGYSRLLA